MSAIDSYQHTHIGNLAHVPVYRMRAPISNSSDVPDATTGDLLLGGGSGEHNAAVIDTRDAVCEFLNRSRAPKRLLGEHYKTYRDEIDEYIVSTYRNAATSRTNWSQWSGDDWYSFVRAARHWGDTPLQAQRQADHRVVGVDVAG